MSLPHSMAESSDATPLRVAILADAVHDHLKGNAAGRPDGYAASWLPSCADALLEEKGLEITWVSLVRGLKARRELHLGPHRFIELPAFPVSLDTRLGYRVARHRLLAELGSQTFDLVHCWGAESPYPSVIGHTSCPAILSLNGILGTLNARGLLPPGGWWQCQAVHEALWLRKADAVIAESQWTRGEILKQVPAARVGIIPYGVHPSFYRLNWEPDSGHPYLFFAGTLSENKGIDLLIDALELLPERRWTCRIAGDGPLRGPMQSRKVPGVEWLGSLAWPAYQDILRKASCIVLPTRADSHPNVIKEARVVGLPVITTREGGQADYLLHGQNSWLLDELTPSSLARTLDQWMVDPAFLRKAGGIGHSEDRARFESSKTADGFASFYRSIARL